MNIGEWKAQLIEQPGIYGAVLYLYRQTYKGEQEFLLKDGRTITVPSEGVRSDKDISFAVLQQDQLQSIAEAFSNFGIKTSNDHKIEGTLEATKYHLEDMRQIALGKQE